MPTYRPVEEWLTIAIPTRQGGHDLTANSASATDASGIVQCLKQNGSTTQFTPVWRLEDFNGSPRTNGLEWDDFLVIREGNSIKACAAVWDQRAIKQVIVRGYSGRLRRWKWLINCFAPLAGWPVLPAAGATFTGLFIASGGAAGCPYEIWSNCFGGTTPGGLQRVRISVDWLGCATHCFGNLRKNWKHRSIASMLYLVYWEDGFAAVSALDQRLPYVEIATL